MGTVLLGGGCPEEQDKVEEKEEEKQKKKENKAVARESTTNPVPVLSIAVSRGFTELTKNVITLLMIVLWSLYTFPENCMQIGPAVFS